MDTREALEHVKAFCDRQVADHYWRADRPSTLKGQSQKQHNTWERAEAHAYGAVSEVIREMLFDMKG